MTMLDGLLIEIALLARIICQLALLARLWLQKPTFTSLQALLIERKSGKVMAPGIEALVSAIDARNRSIGHSIRVAAYAVQIAEAMGYQAQTLEQIYLGALLHDIGQIYWPEEILHNYKAPLTENERKIIESHTYKGVDLITNWPQLRFVRPYILYHQEWIDGSGYPFGLKGHALPTEVQIVSLADVFEALHHPRLYKKRAGYSCQKALAIMDEMKGRSTSSLHQRSIWKHHLKYYSN